MPARKRGRQEVEQEEQPRKQEPTKLEKLRNTWEFASLVQYIYIFGSVVKIDEDIDVDELEAECLKPTSSEKLAQIGLALLKYVSSHKGLTLEIFDEYARRQYVAKAPQRNPFGVDEEPKKFNDMDTFTKVRILQQLSTWTLGNADRIREKMPEQKDIDQTSWRVEAFGWDKEDRTYFVLDDDRLYRRTDPPLPAAPPQKSKPKSKAKPKKTKGTRASKRRRLSTSPSESDAEQEEDGAQDAPAPEEDTFGGMTWECVAVTLEDYTTFVDSIRKSRDPNEKELVKRLQADVIPIIEKRAEQQRQKALRKQRELENLEKLANAKRSSRIAGRLEKQKEQEAAVEAERKRVSDLEMAKKEQEKQKQMEEARQSRMMTREQRLKEREVKRILHEEELKKLQENSEKAENNEMRMSERHLKAEMERRQKELEQMAQEEENWIFDCAVCGVHGENLDDGSHSIACEKCNVWQHSACHGIAKATAERDDFHFVCSDCKQKAEDAARPKLPPLKFKPQSATFASVRLWSSVTIEAEPGYDSTASHVFGIRRPVAIKARPRIFTIPDQRLPYDSPFH
ncbi:Reticulocyte-binding protein 2-like protein a [Lasiodiplodia hormozganensis]|uniref:Reticulocyte-binding protein 2-like protein a n=1 Tax=Lasiodiplodia hormozganensis TaxID=869390 RepID=A0AA40CQT4_9PEZI|nr:Reticulocyte-binding protein 2-like protein a [Lasiodiplodia hormozganensis]